MNTFTGESSKRISSDRINNKITFKKKFTPVNDSILYVSHNIFCKPFDNLIHHSYETVPVRAK